MPRYYFNTSDGRKHPDEEGVELSDDHHARVYATKYAGEVLMSEPESLKDGHTFNVEVVNELGVTLFAICSTLSDGKNL